MNPAIAPVHISMWQGFAENSINYIEFGLRHPGAYPEDTLVKVFFIL
jgi:hypothetical protein